MDRQVEFRGCCSVSGLELSLAPGLRDRGVKPASICRDQPHHNCSLNFDK